MASLIVLDGSVNGVRVQVLKEDGYNTNILSERLIKKYQKKFHVVKRKVVIQHLKSNSNEDSSQIVVNGSLRITDHFNTSNWVIFNSKYDVLLEMP